MSFVVLLALFCAFASFISSILAAVNAVRRCYHATMVSGICIAVFAKLSASLLNIALYDSGYWGFPLLGGPVFGEWGMYSMGIIPLVYTVFMTAGILVAWVARGKAVANRLQPVSITVYGDQMSY